MARPIFFPRIDDNHCDKIHSSFTSVRCFKNGYVGKQPVTLKEYCAEYRLKDLQESMNRSTSRRDITEILMKTPLNTLQSLFAAEFELPTIGISSKVNKRLSHEVDKSRVKTFCRSISPVEQKMIHVFRRKRI